MDQLNQQEIISLRSVEETLQAYNRLILKEQSCRIELDKQEGQENFRQYVASIERLMKETKANQASRTHRDRYTNAYKVLYTQGSLGYIPQIYDSAQESFPLIFVNGQRYDFSSEVLILGERLVQAHFRLVHQLRVAILKGDSWKECMRAALEQLDVCWVGYQEKYITELIRIQEHAKTIIRGFIEAQKNLFDFQTEQKLKGKIFLSGQQYESLRKKLSQSVSRLNAVANVEGKGRDDLGIEVLLAAEQVLGSVTEDQAKSIRILAEKIRSSWEGVRQVLRFFGENFEMVDPQLRNNLQLVAALRDYEYSWQRGKRYFLQKQKQSQILACSAIVQSAREKYPKFRDMLQQSDPKVFWIIPSLIVLRSLQGEDQGLTQSSFQQINLLSKKIEYESLKKIYEQKKKQSFGGFSYYNRLQQLLVGQQQAPEQFFSLVNHIKQLAINLERVCPNDWNDMLGVLLLSQE